MTFIEVRLLAQPIGLDLSCQSGADAAATALERQYLEAMDASWQSMQKNLEAELAKRRQRPEP